MSAKFTLFFKDHSIAALCRKGDTISRKYIKDDPFFQQKVRRFYDIV